jgi:Bacteriophage protein of unknown function (DUF646).
MPFISIRVEGLDQIIAELNGLDLRGAKMQALQEVGDFMANEMRNNAHVITGQMKASITNTVTGDTALVEVLAPYAAFENRRIGGSQGQHNFADRARDATMRMAPNIVKEAYDTIL